MRSELFAEANQERQSTERWVKQSSKMLRINVSGGRDVLAAKGAMVAYQGQVEFQHEGAGAGRMLKKLVTGEGTSLMRVRGEGEVFFARDAANVFTVQLENEGLSVNGRNLLAFDPDLQWDIKMLRSGNILAGGLFNVEIGGNGTIGLSCEGQPLLLDCSQQPTFVDPNAAVCWSSSLSPSVVNSMNMRSMLRGGSGEAFQLAFHGPGFVVVQPSEGRPEVSGSNGGSR
ncbi:AIM24 family protein [Agrococcus sp. ARC_14]|uniref:AIM24 family protein n=1 Tax=Agrococcus sp. ARC_14 TaxID=2919927 RepID=UPI001F05DD5E|nr:AIM24 family protein [Agrococcus sp. ARC_14]MCH1882637.1 AIM24 family protein [Agrococcus sp. ARC_14]